MSDYLSDTENVERRIESEDKNVFLSGLEEERNLLIHREMCGLYNAFGNRNSSIHGLTASYFDDLEKSLSSQIQALTNARKRALKVKALCENPQWPHFVKKTKTLQEISHEHERLTGIQKVPQCQSKFENQSDFRIEQELRTRSIGETTSYHNFNASSREPQRPENTLELEKQSRSRKASQLSPNADDQSCLYNGQNIVGNATMCHNIVNTQTSNPIQYNSGGFSILKKSPYCQRNVITNDDLAIEKNYCQEDRRRQRKDAHNKVEKKRRCFINDKIAELGYMLPKDDSRTTNIKKGAILKNTVDYMKTLTIDQDMMERLQGKVNELDIEFQKMSERIERLELRPKKHVSDYHPNSKKNATTITNIDSYNGSTQTQVDYPIAKEEHVDQQIHTFMPDMKSSYTQNDAFHEEWDALSQSFNDESTLNPMVIPVTFPSTLSTYF